MKQNNQIYGIGAAVGMLLLILDSKTAVTGAWDGIELCLRTVIPSLFPFFIISAALTSSLAGMKLPLLRPLGRLCGIPSGSETVLLTGFLGGYPVGAQSVAQAYENGQLSLCEANRMFAFCNNAGPSFLFGIIAGCFPSVGYAWALWGIHIAGAVTVAILLPREDTASMLPSARKPLSMQDIMKRSLTIMANVCGWIIGFRVLLAFLARWVFWLFPIPAQVLLSGLLELTNGCCMLTQVENVGLRFILCAGMLSFGGLCVTMQTISVTGALSFRRYIFGKLSQTAICVCMAAVCQSFFPNGRRFPVPALWIAGLAVGICIFLAARRQKNSSNPMTVGV